MMIRSNTLQSWISHGKVARVDNSIITHSWEPCPPALPYILQPRLPDVCEKNIFCFLHSSASGKLHSVFTWINLNISIPFAILLQLVYFLHAGLCPMFESLYDKQHISREDWGHSQPPGVFWQSSGDKELDVYRDMFVWWPWHYCTQYTKTEMRKCH